MKSWPIGVIALLLSSRPALATDVQAEPLRLSWVRADSADACPDAREVARRVRDRLGRDPFSEDASSSAEVTVGWESGSFVARVRIRGGGGSIRGQRVLQSEEGCDPLASAVALAIALYIDPEAALRPKSVSAPVVPTPLPPPPLTPEATPPVAPAIARPVAAPLPPPAPAPTAKGRASVSLDVVATLGLLPVLSAAPRLAADYAITSRLHTFLTSTFAPVVRTSSGQFGFGVEALGAGACFDVASRRRIEVGPCLDLQGGQIDTIVYTRTPLLPGGRPWGAVDASVRARGHLVGPLFVDAALGATAPLVRYVFSVVGPPSTVVFQEPVLAPFGYLGAGLTFR